MAEPDLTILGANIAALQQDVRDIKFAADVDRQDRRAERDTLVRHLGTSLGLFQGKVEAQLGDVNAKLADMDARLVRIETMLSDIARKLDA
jgi:hypothetical protein